MYIIRVLIMRHAYVILTINNTAAGNYQVIVKGFKVLSSQQKFYIAYDWDSTNFFKWKRFSRSDFAQSGDEELVRWETNISGTGSVEYAFPPFDKWNKIQ